MKGECSSGLGERACQLTTRKSDVTGDHWKLHGRRGLKYPRSTSVEETPGAVVRRARADWEPVWKRADWEPVWKRAH